MHFGTLPIPWLLCWNTSPASVHANSEYQQSTFSYNASEKQKMFSSPAEKQALDISGVQLLGSKPSADLESGFHSRK